MRQADQNVNPVARGFPAAINGT